MVAVETFKKLALSFPGTTEAPHFDKIAFRTKARIFATLDLVLQQACVKLTPIDQSVFCKINPVIIYPVDNKWGNQGWTIIELKKSKQRNVERRFILRLRIGFAGKKIALRFNLHL